MALVACKECGGQISDQARHCPHCGIPLNKKRGCLYWTGGSVAAVVIVLGIALYNVDPGPSAPATSTEPPTVPAVPAQPPAPEHPTATETAPPIIEPAAEAEPTPAPIPPKPTTNRVKVDRDDHLEQCRDMIHLAMRDQGLEAHGILLRPPAPTLDGLQSVWTVGMLRFECLSRPTGTGGFNHWLYHKGEIIEMFPDLVGPSR